MAKEKAPKRDNSMDTTRPRDRDGNVVMAAEVQAPKPCDHQSCQGSCESALLEKGAKKAEHTYLAQSTAPPLAGRSLNRHELPKLLFEILANMPEESEYSFTKMIECYRRHDGRLAQTTERESQKRFDDETNHQTHLVFDMSNVEMVDLKKDLPDSPDGAGRVFIKYLMSEMLGGRPCGPVHAACLCLYWLKYHNFQPGSLMAGELLSRDVLALLKVSLVLNAVNTTLGMLDGDVARRPTDGEMKFNIYKHVKDVSYLSLHLQKCKNRCLIITFSWNTYSARLFSRRKLLL